MLSHSNRSRRAIEQFLRQSSDRHYDRRLRSLMRRPWLVVGVVAVLAVLGAVTFRSIPDRVRACRPIPVGCSSTSKGPEGSSFEYMDNYARRFESHRS